MSDPFFEHILGTVGGLMLPAAIFACWWATRDSKAVRPEPKMENLPVTPSVRPMHWTGLPDASVMEVMIIEWYLDPPIHWYTAADEDWWPEGPPPTDGFYIHPFCDPGCCRSWGPFPTKEAAREWSRSNLLNNSHASGDKRIDPEPKA